MADRVASNRPEVDISGFDLAQF
ncbi:uncharacterized protein METZ01_LOCUS199379 [marine metagenome]|uniref:Uncharacterized protein n=1 Tax=marine metagenome TaxID=408172 RepID=A0A382E7V5_9ZZZZ